MKSSVRRMPRSQVTADRSLAASYVGCSHVLPRRNVTVACMSASSLDVVGPCSRVAGRAASPTSRHRAVRGQSSRPCAVKQVRVGGGRVIRTCRTQSAGLEKSDRRHGRAVGTASDSERRAGGVLAGLRAGGPSIRSEATGHGPWDLHERPTSAEQGKRSDTSSELAGSIAAIAVRATVPSAIVPVSRAREFHPTRERFLYPRHRRRRLAVQPT
jgi:hypothetical protein